MDAIELFPSLSRCIETIAKETFWSLVSRRLESDQEDRELEEQIELLKAFLESTDFRELRSQSEKHLVQGKTVKFRIYRKDGKPNYQMVIT